MSDSEVIHRWLTQADLDEMLKKARVDAAHKALYAARDAAKLVDGGERVDAAIRVIDPFKVGL
jgi:hypothetical protein